MPHKILTLTSCLILLTATSLVQAAESTPSAPVQSVMPPYIQIHDALAKDSLEGVSAAASALGQAARNDQRFPNELRQEAQTLAQARDLATA
ncbi:MAG TPA: hypothetical protein VGC39_11840, partial [Candidatus Methylacidiphilales bacterium]